MDIFVLIISCIISYLLGGISVARIITKKNNNAGITNEGSGNPGTMNMLRNHGIGMGLFTLLCDALKGVIPALFGLFYFKDYGDHVAYTALYLFGLCAVIGHIFPIYYKFKGGKGIATTFGVFLVAAPRTSLVLFVIMVIALLLVRIGSVVSLLFITIQAVVQMFMPYASGNWPTIVLIWFMILLDIWAHRANLVRLVDDKENPADLQDSIQKDIDKIKTKRKQKKDTVTTAEPEEKK